MVSIILSTCNRAASLRETIQSLARIRVPQGSDAELVLVDNASTDETPRVLQETKLPNLSVQCLREPKRGKSNALNAGLARARGEFLLFTDDDVSVPADWMERMIGPMAGGQSDAVVGPIKLADKLMRPWIGAGYDGFLAMFDFKSGPIELVGANAGFRRQVLQRVPGFDSELGPGALGLGEDTLFGWQLEEAGFKIALAPQAEVVHHPGESRLLRRAWLGSARSLGRSRAYIHYHWEHEDIQAPFLKWLWMEAKLRIRRQLQRPTPLDSEGCPAWELSYVRYLETYKQFCAERRRPRNYAKRGLTKLGR